MKDIEPINSVSVDLSGRSIKLSRSELDSDENLKELLSDFDRVREEIAKIDFERRKLTNAFLGMQIQINKRAETFAEEKYGSFIKPSDDDKDEYDDQK